MFNPFDERCRDREKRRKSNEIEFDKQQWVERIDKHFRRAMDALEWPNYVQSNWLLNEMLMDERTNLSDRMLRRNVEPAMNRLGWRKSLNPKSKDGRWSNSGENFFVYAKEGFEQADRTTLTKELGW